MPTTDIRLARLVLEQCTSAGFEFALLHPLPKVADGEAISDVDLVWGTPPGRAAVLDIAHRVLKPLGLYLVIACPYDVGAVALFALSGDGRNGLQVDLVHDEHGRGRLGIRYAALIRETTAPAGTPVVNDIDRLIYLARKRHWKEQERKLAEVIVELRQVKEQVRIRSMHLLTKRAQRDLDRLIAEGTEVTRKHVRRNLSSVPAAFTRLIRRLRYPVGAWVHLSGAPEGLARELSRRFDRIVVYSRVLPHRETRTAGLQDWLTSIVSVRWRPGIVISYGTRPSLSTPDVVVAAAQRPTDDVAHEVVSKLALRPGLLSSIA